MLEASLSLAGVRKDEENREGCLRFHLMRFRPTWRPLAATWLAVGGIWVYWSQLRWGFFVTPPLRTPLEGSATEALLEGLDGGPIVCIVL